MRKKQMEKNIFTILYELGKQKFLIGVTDEKLPMIASIGVNTARPLPTNMRQALINIVKEIRVLKTEPNFIDYNAPSSRLSTTLLANFSINPIDDLSLSVRTMEEALQVLKNKMCAV